MRKVVQLQMQILAANLELKQDSFYSVSLVLVYIIGVLPP
jgi:hypothetical protein